MKHIPDAAQAKEFAECMRFWQEFLNLQDWRIEPGLKPAPNGAMASVEFNDPARLATYRLGDFCRPVTKQLMGWTSLHETLHVLLRDLIVTLQDRSSTPDQLEAAEHRVINVLEKLLIGAMNAETSG